MRPHLITAGVAAVTTAVVLAFFLAGYVVRGLVDEGRMAGLPGCNGEVPR